MDKKSVFQSEESDSELTEYLSVRQHRRWIFPRAALVGAFAGVIALLFRIALSTTENLHRNLIYWLKENTSYGWVFSILLTIIGAIISVVVVKRFSPEAGGGGIPYLEAVLQRFRVMNFKRLLPVKFFGGIIAIGSGLALGSQGPTVQMGGAVGDGVSRLLKVTERERLTLISAGAGAGLAAAFNAPLSGLIFVLEEVRRDFQPIVFGAAFIAAVIADIIARIGAGQFPVFSLPSYPVSPLGSLPIFAVMGVLAGLSGVIFNKSLLTSTKLFARIPKRHFTVAVAIVGGVIGLAGWFEPILVGSGHSLAQEALNGRLSLRLIPLFFVLRFFFTNISSSTGAPGGIFAPLLVLGALLGASVGKAAFVLMPNLVPEPAVYAVVGMAALFTAIVRAPLTGIMLIVEMTGNYSQMLPLLVSCFSAYIVAEGLKDTPIYEALLDRELRQGGIQSQKSNPIVIDFTVQPHSAFSGQQIRDLGLPSGCIIVRCYDGKREWVPKASTRLEAHTRITAVIAPEATNGLAILREGCKKSHNEI